MKATMKTGPCILYSNIIISAILTYTTSTHITGKWKTANGTEEALKKLLHVFQMDGRAPEGQGHYVPPQYMLDLYRSFSERSGTSLHRHRSNTVRSFQDKGNSDNSHSFFSVSDGVFGAEEIVEAEFHLFINRNIHKHHSSTHFIQIQLYEGRETLLEARLVSTHASTWEVFKVTPSVRRWTTNADMNQGLFIRVLDSLGREWSARRVRRLSGHRRPILVVFSRDPKTTTTRMSVSRKSAKIEAAKIPTDKNTTLEASNSIRSARSTPLLDDPGCTRHELRVDFERIGWSSWIISPKWYDAYVCAGACAFPLGQNQRPTNHATVQSIVHELGLIPGVGTPCCVPTELQPVNLLYFDEYRNVVLKQYDDMVANGCGCQ